MLRKNGSLARCTREAVQEEGARLGNLGQDQLGDQFVGN